MQVLVQFTQELLFNKNVILNLDWNLHINIQYVIVIITSGLRNTAEKTIKKQKYLRDKLLCFTSGQLTWLSFVRCVF